MVEKTATEASNDFWLEFKAERQAIDDQLQKSSTIPTNELPVHFNTILQNINNLDKKLTKATEFIPSYDERQFSLQLKELNDLLAAAKAELTPKAKFSFKSRKNKAAVVPSTKSVPSPCPLPNVESEILSDATVLFEDKKDMVLTLKDSEKAQTSQKSIEILLSNIQGCVIILQEEDVHISAIHIKNLDRCIIYCGSIEGSMLMYGLTNSVLIVDCHQLRMHDAHHVDMMLNVSSRPIMEDSNHITVGRLNRKAPINYFDQIEDFNWLKKQASPNWSLMDQDRHATLDNHMPMFTTDNKENGFLTKLLNLLRTDQ